MDQFSEDFMMILNQIGDKIWELTVKIEELVDGTAPENRSGNFWNKYGALVASRDENQKMLYILMNRNEALYEQFLADLEAKYPKKGPKL